MVYHKILNNVFLCCTVGPCCFSILYLPVCNPKLSLLPSPIHFPLGPGTFKVFHIWSHNYPLSRHYCCCSVSKYCLTLGNPMDVPAFPILHYIVEFAQILSIELVTLSNHLILCHPLLSCLDSFPASGSFPMSQFFALGGQSIRASASASVLPMNIQDWFPFRLTGWSPCCPRVHYDYPHLARKVRLYSDN